jgi:general secretion pathway protein I
LSRATRSRFRRSTSGFTLIEVLVALAIIAVCLVSIGSVIGTTVRGTRALERHVALIETARAIETGLPDRSQLHPGTLTGDYSGYRWRVDVSPFADGALVSSPSSHFVPQAVVITVTSPSGASVRIDTVRLRRKDRG